MCVLLLISNDVEVGAYFVITELRLFYVSGVKDCSQVYTGSVQEGTDVLRHYVVFTCMYVYWYKHYDIGNFQLPSEVFKVQ